MVACLKMSSVIARAFLVWTPALALGVAMTNAEMTAQTALAEQSLVQQADRRIRDLQAESDRLANQARTLLGELRALELAREIKTQEVKKAEAAREAVAKELEEASARVERLEAQRVSDAPSVNERLVELYKRGRGGYARLLLQTDDLRALGRMSRGVAAVARLDRARFDAHRRTMRAEREALAALETKRASFAAAQADALKARQALDSAIAVHNRRIDELDRKRDLAAQYVGELQTAQAELQQRVSTLPGPAATALPLAPFRGSLEWPVTGRVVSRFGTSRDGRSGVPVVRNGIEIAATPGQPVRAVHAGTVAFAAPFTGFGTLVIVDHGQNAFTLFGHLAEATVEQGASINRGVVLGRAGRNPAGLDVVYFELRIDGRPVDPVQWLRGLE
jgi:septal ring factor EnvC (AmiA/AmiB activator)